MQIGSKDGVDVLNDLVKTTLESAEGYRQAAENIRDPVYVRMFTERAGRRQQLASELQHLVVQMGGDPKEDRGIAGAIHNAFVDVKSALSRGDEKSIIDEVERGEDHIRDKFRDALNRVPDTARMTVSTAYEMIKTDHDEISQLKRMHS